MEYQGTPTSGSNSGTKVTTDPRSNTTIHESTGPIASDSLAADSYRQGGGFSENRDPQPNAVSGSSSTWNNTDTSGAYTLPAAPSASRRQDESSGSGSGRYPEAAGGQGRFSGRHGDASGGYVGGPSGDGSGSSGNYGAAGSGSAGGNESGNGDSSSSAGTAPNYALNQQGAFQGSKPKGSNLTEGGFSGEGTNYNSGIGTRDDPGRQAVQGFAKSAASAAPGGPKQYGGVDNDQPYEALDRNERA